MCPSFVWTYIFTYLGYIPRNDVAMFNFLRSFQSVFQSYCNILHSKQQWMRVPGSSYAYQHSLFYFFLDYSHFSGCGMVSHDVFELRFLNTNDVDHLFCAYWSLIYLLEKNLFKSFAHFQIGLFAFVLLSCILYIF